MDRIHRVVLSCLLALLLPLQGFAATTMLLCSPSHHAEHHAADSATHEHHTDAKAKIKPAGGKCSACVACCMSAAIGSATVVLPVVPVAAVYAACSFAAPMTVVSSGLKRPPKILLA